MEMWQRQGFASFGDWRRATERARRLKNKVSVASPAIGASLVQPVNHASVLTWEPVQELPLPSSPPSPRSSAAKDWGGELPGKLSEHVRVTPHGSRAHRFEHTSPGGNVRNAEYVSPAGPAKPLKARREWSKPIVAERSKKRREALEEDMERQIINGTWSRPLSGRGKLSRKRPLWSYLPRPEWYGKRGVSDSEASEAEQEQESKEDHVEEEDIEARSWSYWMARGRGQCCEE